MSKVISKIGFKQSQQIKPFPGRTVEGVEGGVGEGGEEG